MKKGSNTRIRIDSGNAWAVVPHLEDDVVASNQGLDFDEPFPSALLRLDGLGRVDEEIQDDLVDLPTHGLDLRKLA